MGEYKTSLNELTVALNSFLDDVAGWNRDDIDGVFSDVNEAASICHNLAKKSGWWDGKDPQDKEGGAVKIALIHSELSEALEGLRKDTMDDHLPHRKTLEVELADAVIRIFDYAGALGLDLGGAMAEKLAYNQQRADHKRENRKAEGGKVF
ncbi:MAG: hypothetical protein ACRCXB_26860 [Aeromonadaceae bacterium]